MFNTGNSSPFTIPLTTESGSNNGNNGAWGDGGWWIVIILFALIFGWGNGGWGGNGSGTTNNSYYTDSAVQRGFDTQSIQTKLDGLTNGLCQQGYQNQQGFHGVDNAVCQLGYQIQDGINSVNTSMLQGFNSSNVALMQGQNALSSQLAQCCCDEQRSLDGINYNIATQACNMQNTMNTNTRDIIDNQNSSTRAILDYLCQDKIDALQNENQALRLSASQSNQNATLLNAMANNTNEIIGRVAPSPVPSFPVNPPFPYCGCNTGHH